MSAVLKVRQTFHVTNRVKQDCVLTPTPFSIFLSSILQEAFRDLDNGVYTSNPDCMDADRLNVSHFQANNNKYPYERTPVRERYRTSSSLQIGYPDCQRLLFNIKYIWSED